MPDSALTAELSRDEAVLRFPYDDTLRLILRAIPGRRWDPQQRAWCIPLGTEQAQSLSRLLESLDRPVVLSEELARTLSRLCARRRSGECPIDVARPDQDLWLSFPTDLAQSPVRSLLAHPGARELPIIGSGLVPLDEDAAEIVGALLAEHPGVSVSHTLRRALDRLGGAVTGGQEPAQGAAGEGAHGAGAHDVEFRRDRAGAHWIVVGPARAPLARVLAARCGLRAAEAPDGMVGLAAVDHDAELIAQLIGELEDATVDPRVRAWISRATTWRGTIDVDGPAGAAVFLLLGDRERLPRSLRDVASPAEGGASLPLTAEWAQALQRLLDAWVTPAARRCSEALAAGRPAPPAVLELSGAHADPTFVLAPGHDRGSVQRFAALPGALAPMGRRGHAGEHAQLPALRADPFCVPALDRFLTDGHVWVEPDALALLQDIREEHARAAGLVALSSAADAELDVPGLGGELKPFQRAGVRYLLERRRSFLADEQGLGKTIEALAAIEAAGAFPAVIVCPASLKLNWLREIARWLPERSAVALSGAGGAAAGAVAGARAGAAGARAGLAPQRETGADITVLNYDILAARAGELCELDARALVLDESHYCKNPAAKRTQAAQRVAASVRGDGLVLALTGTPVTNRPAELISQLRILGRLAEFGSGARFAERFRGPDAHLRLHWHLRARCFARRCKAEVLPQLPAKTRSIVPIELDNEAEYRLAERDVVAWLASQPLDLRELDARVAAALRAERLVRLNALKLLAARGKLAAALRWIHDFSTSGERLVVFARHREIQRAVLEQFPAALHILGQDSAGARDLALEEFQGPDAPGNQLIVCSIEVAGQGLTLTRSSSVVFLELDWTPAKHDQAEDRCHRIGQQDAVNAYYLLAADTVDESIATLLERKRSVIGAVTDGREQDEEGVVEALVRELRGSPYRHLRAVA